MELVASPAVEEVWLEPSALAGYRVGGLAVHLVRAIETIRQYSETERPLPGDALVDAVSYYAAVLGNHDPIASDFHDSIRARSERRVDSGHRALVAAATDALTWLDSNDLDPHRPVKVLDGVAVRLGDYLDTRLVELVIHSDDLAASVGIEPPAFADAAWQVVAGVLSELAQQRYSPRLLALSLARAERFGPATAFGLVPQLDHESHDAGGILRLLPSSGHGPP
ncbi:MAG: maleylpyruvate isomerase N-terminal domain-containing protein [Chloroflexi bacterium]|nr:maleylpyruvate isomerase N-terminal domain-containing protein [Chloroflexota bacterium]